MVTVSASANKFDAVSGALEWEDFSILISKPHTYPTVINMSVPRMWLSGPEYRHWGKSTEMGREMKVLKQEWPVLPLSATKDTNTIFFLFFQDLLLQSFVYPLAISLQVNSLLLSRVIWPLFTLSHWKCSVEGHSQTPWCLRDFALALPSA